MSLVGFNDPAKWSEVITGTGIVHDKRANSFQMTVTAKGDSAGLITADIYTEPIEVSIFLTGNTARSGIFLDPIGQEGRGYGVIRDPAYGLLIAAHGGFPFQLRDPIARTEPAEMRLRIAGGTVYFYYDGVQIYSMSVADWMSKQFRALIHSSSTLASGEVVPGTNIASSEAPPPPPLTINVQPTSAQVGVGQSAALMATVSGGVLPYTVRWIDNVSKQVLWTGASYTFTPTEAGLYEVYAEVTDGVGTTAKSSVIPITVSEIPPAPPTPISRFKQVAKALGFLTVGGVLLKARAESR